MHKLVELGTKRYNEIKEAKERLIKLDPQVQTYYDDIETYPHLFVLGCLMDKQIGTERAWMIPYQLCLDFNTFDMDTLSQLSSSQISEWFTKNHPHRFNSDMADVFHEAIQRIHTDYNDDASQIWEGKPASATVVTRFRQFKGAGEKIAAMAAIILNRDYDIEFEDYTYIDVPPDTHVCRIFYRLRLTQDENDKSAVIYKARELNPAYPGIIDSICWEVGRDYCHPTNPECSTCPLNECCSYANRQ